MGRLAEIKHYFEQGGAIQTEDARWLLKRHDELVEALIGMVEQYCDWKDDKIGPCYFHLFMGAGEDAFEALEVEGRMREIERECYEILPKEQTP